MKWAFGLGLALIAAAPLLAQETKAPDPKTETAHVVKAGETLGGIAARAEVPGNRDLTAPARAERRAAIYAPYHDTIRRRLDTRTAQARATIYIAVHSFTPVYHGQARPWQVGVLGADQDRRLADAMLDFLRAQGDVCVGDNEPYRIDEKDEGIPAHALTRGLPHVLLEIRQDLIAQDAGQKAWAQRLAVTLEHARQRLGI